MADTNLPHDDLWVALWGRNYRSHSEFQVVNEEFRRGRDIGMIRIDAREALRNRQKSDGRIAHISQNARGW